MSTNGVAPPLIDDALVYARAGVPVFTVYWINDDGSCGCGKAGCSSPGKHPIPPAAPNGFKNATTDEPIIKGWWSRWPLANIGMPTGAASGYVVIDIDPEHGGNEGLSALETKHGALPVTRMVRTGGGGTHFIFKYPGVEIRNSGGKLAPGVDIRGEGGYVVVSPSMHRSGKRYEYLNQQPAAELPPTWLALLTEQKQEGVAEATEGGVTEGSRNTYLASALGWHRRQGATADDLRAIAYVLNARFNPPLANDEVDRVIASVSRYDPAPRQYAHTDGANAELFADLVSEDVCYDHRRRIWLMFDGTRCKPDRDGEVFRLLRLVPLVRQQAAMRIADDDDRAKELKYAAGLDNRRPLENIEVLARSNARLKDAGDDWDKNPDLLAVANGVIELPTTTFRAGRRDDRLTISAAVAYDANAVCPRWERFIAEVLPDVAVAAFFQRLMGYSLTGHVREQILPIWYGGGSNGKSTAKDTLLDVQGDYAKTAAPGLLIASRNERHPTELADLKGARFVPSVEVEDGKWLAEAVVKMLTGGDQLNARRMHKDFEQFRPTHKLHLLTNHRPVVRGTDLAIWRRLRLIPFTQRFEGAAQDLTLADTLRAEGPGILNWLLAGARDWYADGLGDVPEGVSAATEEYRTDMDLIGQFIEERCEVGPDAEASAETLFSRYANWASNAGIHRPMTATMFGRKLGERDGITKYKQGTKTWYRGIK